MTSYNENMRKNEKIELLPIFRQNGLRKKFKKKYFIIDFDLYLKTTIDASKLKIS